MSTHTKEPWSASKPNEVTDIIITGNVSKGKHGGRVGDLIATVSCGLSATQAANAAFIVRACNAHEEMLAALKAMLETYACNHEKTAQSEGEHMLIACVRDARKAIAKAEGRN